jgi:hypothetical protein
LNTQALIDSRRKSIEADLRFWRQYEEARRKRGQEDKAQFAHGFVIALELELAELEMPQKGRVGAI